MARANQPLIDKIKEQKISILFTVLGMITSLAFTKLLDLGGNLLSGVDSWGDKIFYISHLFLVMLIIIRIFEALLLAALDYEIQTGNFYDLIAVFIIGIIEYWMLETFKEYDQQSFFLRLLILGALSLTGFSIATIRLITMKPLSKVKTYSNKMDFIREIYLQSVNLAVSLGFIVVSLLIFLNVISSNLIITIIMFFLCILMAFNIYYSYFVTVTLSGKEVGWRKEARQDN